MTDLTKPISQMAFGRLVGVGPRSVTEFLTRGIIRPGSTGVEWLLQYTQHLREVTARHQSADGKRDLVAERAALTWELRQTISRRSSFGPQ